MNEEELKAQKKEKNKNIILSIFTGIFKVIGTIIKTLFDTMGKISMGG